MKSTIITAFLGFALGMVVATANSWQNFATGFFLLFATLAVIANSKGS